jgi:hypothetical protein
MATVIPKMSVNFTIQGTMTDVVIVSTSLFDKKKHIASIKKSNIYPDSGPGSRNLSPTRFVLSKSLTSAPLGV